jgi:hypothetical protein
MEHCEVGCLALHLLVQRETEPAIEAERKVAARRRVQPKDLNAPIEERPGRLGKIALRRLRVDVPATRHTRHDTQFLVHGFLPDFW